MNRKNSENSLVRAITEIPDRSCPVLMAIADNNVETAVCQAFEQLLRVLGDMPPDSAAIAITFAFNPEVERTDPQARLKIYLRIRAGDSRVAKALSAMITQGPISQFYPMDTIAAPNILWGQLKAACHVYRRDRLLRSVISCEENEYVPEKYYACQDFEPNDENDYLLVDSVLNGINEPVVIDICAAPADSTNDSTEHTLYLSRLQKILRSWHREDEFAYTEQLLGANVNFHTRENIAPLREDDPVARDLSRTQQRFHESFCKPHVNFHVVALAKTDATARLIGSVVAESGFKNGSYQLFTHLESASLQLIKKHVQDLEIIDHDVHSHLCSHADLGGYPGMRRIPHITPVDSFLGTFRLPTASSASLRCVRKNTDPENVVADELIVMGHDMVSREIAEKKPFYSVPRGITVNNFSKHLAIFGVPGSAKTTTIIQLMISLWAKGIPVIVFETAKKEYRAIKKHVKHKRHDIRKLARDLEIYTPDNEQLSPFRLNLLEIPAGRSVDHHIDATLAGFEAGMPTSGPLPALLGEALEEVYERKRNTGAWPVLIDVLDVIETVVRRKGYSADVHSDICGALYARISLLTSRTCGPIFQCRKTIPDIPHFFSAPTIIELDGLPQKQKCLTVLFEISAIRYALGATPMKDKGLRLLLIIEEAHNVIGGSTDASPSEDNPDPKAYASEFLSRLAQECRGLGCGMVFSDQNPSTIPSEIINNTGSKAVGRLLSNSDREEAGGAMLFGKTEYEEVARLRTGEMYLFTDGYHMPKKIKMINLHHDLNLDPPDDDELLNLISCEKWFREARQKRQEVELAQLHAKMNEFDRKRCEVVHSVQHLLSQYPRILNIKHGNNRLRLFDQMIKKAVHLKTELTNRHREFVRGPYRNFMPEKKSVADDSGLARLRQDQVHRYESVIERDINNCLLILDKMIAKCKTSMERNKHHG